jgi:hypothetical protein
MERRVACQVVASSAGIVIQASSLTRLLGFQPEHEQQQAGNLLDHSGGTPELRRRRRIRDAVNADAGVKINHNPARAFPAQFAIAE